MQLSMENISQLQIGQQDTLFCLEMLSPITDRQRSIHSNSMGTCHSCGQPLLHLSLFMQAVSKSVSQTFVNVGDIQMAIS